MDFPIFHLDGLGNRMLIAIIAILHVFISHGFAVGAIPLVVWLERKGLIEPDWDKVARRLMFVAFILTTTVGAMSGVGIWFSSSLVNPTSIGSLIRVFFWAWFVEWIVFVTEVVLMLWYYLSWDSWKGQNKQKHIRLGSALALFSWITMMIIVAILSFMMDPGSWQGEQTFLSSFFNPVYLPQLFFRTPLAMTMAGTVGLVILRFSSDFSPDLRKKVLRSIGGWILFWLPFLLFGSFAYYQVIPQFMKTHFGVALATQQFESWYYQLKLLIVFSLLYLFIVSLLSFIKCSLPKAAHLMAAILVFSLVAMFERSREFIRKPFVIGQYLYANGLRKEDYPLLQKEGLLAHAPYVTVRQINENNKLQAGKELFMLACSRCHTINGINAVVDKLHNMYGNTPWSESAITDYLSVMHKARTFMPPFPGSAAEREALAAYLVSLQKDPKPVRGVQDEGAQYTPFALSK